MPGKQKRISITPLITEAKRNYCFSCFSQEAVEDDLLTFGTLLGVRSIDYERLYLYDSSLDITAPLAIRLRQGLYLFNSMTREKILGWNLDHITESLGASRRAFIYPILERLQYYVGHTLNKSLLDVYFNVFADMQTLRPNIKKSIGFSWAQGYENTNSRHTPIEELILQIKMGISLQDPAYTGQEPQWPDMDFIRKHFELGLPFQGSAIAYLRNPKAEEKKPQPLSATRASDPLIGVDDP